MFIILVCGEFPPSIHFYTLLWTFADPPSRCGWKDVQVMKDAVCFTHLRFLLVWCETEPWSLSGEKLRLLVFDPERTGGWPSLLPGERPRLTAPGKMLLLTSKSSLWQYEKKCLFYYLRSHTRATECQWTNILILVKGPLMKKLRMFLWEGHFLNGWLLSSQRAGRSLDVYLETKPNIRMWLPFWR